MDRLKRASLLNKMYDCVSNVAYKTFDQNQRTNYEISSIELLQCMDEALSIIEGELDNHDVLQPIIIAKSNEATVCYNCGQEEQVCSVTELCMDCEENRQTG